MAGEDRPQQGIVLAAGRGSRLAAARHGLPKPLVPLAGRPLIDYQLAKLAAAGICEAIVVINPGAEHAFRAWAAVTRPPLPIVWAHQAEPRGTAHALACAVPFLAGGPFVFVAADQLTACPLEPLLALLLQEPAALVAQALVPARGGHDGPPLAIAGERLRDIDHRDAAAGELVGAGMATCRPALLDWLPPPQAPGEHDLLDVWRQAVEAGAVILNHVHRGWHVNVNTPDDLHAAARLLHGL